MPTEPTDAWQIVRFQEKGYAIHQRGSHCEGTYVRVYVPLPPDPGMDVTAGDTSRKDPLRVILYLHGFALCMPSFYEEHLRELVSQGHVVIFPDFQRSLYPNTPPGEEPAEREPLEGWGLWRRGLRTIRTIGDDEDVYASTLRAIVGEDRYGPARPVGPSHADINAGDLRRAVRPLLIVFLLLHLLGWFRRSYGKNLIHLLSTVALSLAYPPRQWLEQAYGLGEAACEHLYRLKEFRAWRDGPVETIAFGHSLGGLLALSLPSRPAPELPSGWLDLRQVVAADPASSTLMGIPALAIWILRLFGSPFSSSPIDIRSTGPCLGELPVTILHGASDTIVPPSQWASPEAPSANFEAIASTSKGLYFSCSDSITRPPLVAFHNQAVTSTSYYDDDLFRSFGGVKHGANAYNYDYLWPALRALLEGSASPEDLLAHLPRRSFQVRTLPPAPVPGRIWWLLPLGLMAILVLLWWLRR